MLGRKRVGGSEKKVGGGRRINFLGNTMPFSNSGKEEHSKEKWWVSAERKKGKKEVKGEGKRNSISRMRTKKENLSLKALHENDKEG